MAASGDDYLNWKYFHRDGDGNWHPFDDETNKKLALGHKRGDRWVKLYFPGNKDPNKVFEVRFGLAAVSKKMTDPPQTGIIQVNVMNENTRLVKREPEVTLADITSATPFAWPFPDKLRFSGKNFALVKTTELEREMAQAEKSGMMTFGGLLTNSTRDRISMVRLFNGAPIWYSKPVRPYIGPRMLIDPNAWCPSRSRTIRICIRHLMELGLSGSHLNGTTLELRERRVRQRLKVPTVSRSAMLRSRLRQTLSDAVSRCIPRIARPPWFTSKYDTPLVPMDE